MKRFQTEFFERLFQSLDNNAVMMQVEEDGTYYPIWCSNEFTEMMEGDTGGFYPAGEWRDNEHHPSG